MATPEELRGYHPVGEGNLIIPHSPPVNWIDLPIARRKGTNPHFDLKEILLHEDQTLRVDCQFETIQQLLGQNYGYITPKDLADQFAQVQKWQFVVPTHVDVAQLLFLGRRMNDTHAISIDEAQATIYIHRGAEGFGKLDGGKYVTTWVELAGIIPDSNGDQRIVGVVFNRYGLDENEAIAAGVNVSFAEAEYDRIPTPMDAFFPSTVDIANHRFGIYFTRALMTKGMIDSLPSPHRRAISLITNPKGGINLHQIGGRDSGLIDFDQGVSLSIKDKIIEVGLMRRSDGGSPWTITIPRTLEPVNLKNF